MYVFGLEGEQFGMRLGVQVETLAQVEVDGRFRGHRRHVEVAGARATSLIAHALHEFGADAGSAVTLAHEEFGDLRGRIGQAESQLTVSGELALIERADGDPSVGEPRAQAFGAEVQVEAGMIVYELGGPGGDFASSPVMTLNLPTP